jgi:uncharacterized membrane protein YdjX (TVP38/TMEM64 family)
MVITIQAEDIAMTESAPPRGTVGRWLLLGVVVIAVLAFFVFGGHQALSWETLQQRQDELRSYRDEQPITTLLLFVLVYLVVASLALPGVAVLSLLAGFLFGRWWGTLLVSLASTTGAMTAFLLSRYVLRDMVRRRLGSWLDRIDRGVESEGAFYLAALRLVPAIPFFAVNAGLGLTRMPLFTFWWVSQLAMLPATFLFVNAGAEWEQVRSPGDVLSATMLVSLALVGVTPLLLKWALRGRREKRSG